MKMGLIVVGISALLIGLLLSSFVWGDYSKSTNYCLSLELQSLELARQKETLTDAQYEYRSKELRDSRARCEEGRLLHRNYLITFLSAAGIGLVLVVSAILFGRKKEPEYIGSIT